MQASVDYYETYYSPEQSLPLDNRCWRDLLYSEMWFILIITTSTHPPTIAIKTIPVLPSSTVVDGVAKPEASLLDLYYLPSWWMVTKGITLLSTYWNIQPPRPHRVVFFHSFCYFYHYQFTTNHALTDPRVFSSMVNDKRLIPLLPSSKRMIITISLYPLFILVHGQPLTSYVSLYPWHSANVAT